MKLLWKLRLREIEVLVMEDVTCMFLLEKAKRLHDALSLLTSDPDGEPALEEGSPQQEDASELNGHIACNDGDMGHSGEAKPVAPSTDGDGFTAIP